MSELDGTTFDVAFLGTGLTECILSGVLSAKKELVLQTDVNSYYGGETASLRLSQIFEKFPTKSEDEQKRRADFLKSTREVEWNIDVTPKLLMYNGFLTSILRFTHVVDSVPFMAIKGSYVLDSRGTPQKVPSTALEAASTGLVGFFEKSSLKKFLSWVAQFDVESPSTYNQIGGFDPRSSPMAMVYKHFGLGTNTIDFIGHALALHTSDAYITTLPALETINRISLYARSMISSMSPYVYPAFGLGDIAQAFARLSGIHGGTFLLRSKLLELHVTDGAVTGVTVEAQIWNKAEKFTVNCTKVVADPSYFPQYVKKSAECVTKAICILQNNKLNSNIPAESMQLIIPKPKDPKSGRVLNDIYLVKLDHELGVCPKGYSIGIVSTICEPDAIPELILKPGLDLFAGATLFRMVQPPTPLEEPNPDANIPKGLFISRSYDATTHFESMTDDVRNLYQQMYGQSLDGVFSKLDKSDWNTLEVGNQ